MISQPWTLVRAPDGRVVVAGDDEIQAIDPDTDALTTLVRAADVPNRPADAFLLDAPDGTTRVAIAFTAIASSGDIRQLWTLAGATVVDRWSLNDGVFPLGLSVISMTQSPVHHGRLLALRNDMWAAAEVDPWIPMRYDMPPLVARQDGIVLRTVAATDDGTVNRVVWTGQTDGVDGAYPIDDETGGPDLRLPLPEHCDDVMCNTFVHAVPDPTERHRVFAICESDGPPRVRKLVRLSATGGGCEVLVEDASLGPNRRFSRLAVVLP